MCNKSQRKKPTLCEISATLCGMNPACFTAFKNTPVIASSPSEHVSSLDYLIHKFDDRSHLIFLEFNNITWKLQE